MIQYKIYSNTNLLNIPRELYKAKDSNAAFKTSSLFFGNNFRNSYKNSINSYSSDRVAGFAKFFASSLNSIKDSVNTFTNDANKSKLDFTIDKTDAFKDNTKNYYESNKKVSDLAPDLGIFINNVNSFLEETEKYENDNVRILNKQVTSDLVSSKDDLLAFGITINDNNRLEFDKNKLTKESDDISDLEKIALKDDSVFNKLASRTDKALNDPVSKYVPLVDNKEKSNNFNMFNYLSNSQKFALNSTSISGSIIDYSF